jgi:iron complex outermembrane receptor protein
VSVILSGAASAQSAGETLTKLEEVIVTAERRDTNLQQTPLSVVAYSEESLKSSGIGTLADMAKFTPGLSMQGLVEGNRPTFTLRGIGQFSGRESSERGVGVYVDDIYLPRTTGSLLELVDVDRVEILRGPQGTLFGRNSTGGAIRYNTRKPTNQFEGRATLKVGSLDRRDVTAMVNIPFTDTFYGRFQFGSFKRNGYVKYATGPAGGDVDDQVARASFRYAPSANLTIDAGITSSLSDRGRTAVIALSNNTVDPLTSAISRALTSSGQPALTVNDPRLVSTDYFKANGACYLNNNTVSFGSTAAGNLGSSDLRNFCNSYTKDRVTTSFVNVNWTLSDRLSLRSTSGYNVGHSDSSQDGGGTGANGARDHSDYDSYSQEFQAKYTTDKFGVVTGLYYFHEHPLHTQRSSTLVFVPILPTFGACCSGGLGTQEYKTDAYGVFSQANYFVTDKLQLIGGLRYSYEDKKTTNYQSDRPALSAANTALGVGPGTLLNNSDKWDSVVYRASLQYQWAADIMTYATVSSGFKAGGFNDSPQNNALDARPGHTNVADRFIPSYDPEKVTNFEVGGRTEWYDHRLRANVTGFLMKYKSIQVSAPVIQTVGVPVLVTSNAGNVDLSGAEVELLAAPVQGLTLNASAAFLHDSWKYLGAGSVLLLKSKCPVVGAVTNTLATCGAQDLAGGPKLQYTLGASYDRKVTADGTLGFSAAYTHVSSKESANSQQNDYTVPGYGLLNGRVQYRTDKWDVALYGTNLFNKQYLIVGQDGTGFFGTISGAPGVSREIGVEVTARF